MKKEDKVCEHNFRYSHSETEPIGYGGVNYKNVDVTVCTNCGEVRRSNK